MLQPRLSASYKRIIPITALLLVLLFKFQNCAPVTQMTSADQDGYDGAPDEVRIVDRWVAEKISFLSSTQIIENENAQIDIQGLCVGSQKGQQIVYQVIEISDDPKIINSGVVECIMGGFVLQVQILNLMSCMHHYQVRAARIDDEKNYAETILRPTCSG